MSRIGISTLVAGAAALSIALSPVVANAAPIPAGSGLLPQSPVSQSNAVRMAKSYLEYSAFSRIGLVKQLAYEGFSKSESVSAVDSLTVDWKKQAAKMAKSYLEYDAFSANGLYKQLMYEGFTSEQAVYGVRSVGF